MTDADHEASAANARIMAHEALCAERYARIEITIDSVKSTVSAILKVMAWGGSTVAVVMLSLISFLTVRLLNANDLQTTQLQAHVQQLEASGGASNRDVIRRADEASAEAGNSH